MIIQNLVISRFYKVPYFENSGIPLASRTDTKWLFTISLFLSGMLGALGVVLLYLPHQMYPHFFPWHEVSNPLVGKIKIKWAFSIYGLVLAFIEIVLLVMLNLVSVSKLAKRYEFPKQDHPDKELHIHTLIDLSLERKPKKLLQMGIDPHQGMRKWAIILFVFVVSLKATISNIFVKLFAERIVGRFFLVEYIDYIGIPIFAAWNIYGTYQVLKSAKLRIVTTEVVDRFVQEMKARSAAEALPKHLYKEALQFVAYCKRGFDHNHYYLTKKVYDELQISSDKVFCDLEQIKYHMKTLGPQQKRDLVEVILLGIIIDGTVSRREAHVVRELKRENIITYDLSQVRSMAKNMSQGDVFGL